MNLPNKLTVIRCVLAPLFLLLLLVDFPLHYLTALVVFIAASLTDLFDGRIARSRGLVTNLGKFLDPLADKMLITAAFLGFLILPAFATEGWGKFSLCWALMLILTREFMVTSVRLLAAKDGVVIAASIAGKTKTVAQMVSVIYVLAALEAMQWLSAFPTLCLWLVIIGHCFVWISVILTLISGFQYVWACRKYFQS